MSPRFGDLNGGTADNPLAVSPVAGRHSSRFDTVSTGVRSCFPRPLFPGPRAALPSP